MTSICFIVLEENGHSYKDIIFIAVFLIQELSKHLFYCC